MGWGAGAPGGGVAWLSEPLLISAAHSPSPGTAVQPGMSSRAMRTVSALLAGLFRLLPALSPHPDDWADVTAC